MYVNKRAIFKEPLEFRAGRSFQLVVRWEVDGAAVDTTGHTAEFILESETPFIVEDVLDDDGVFTVEISVAEVEDLDFEAARAALVVTEPREDPLEDRVFDFAEWQAIYAD
jgi:hypothetical protein